jgi:NTE family protein
MIIKMANAKPKAKKMSDASSYSEWKAAAIARDKKQGHDDWKKIEKSNRYDYAAIKRRLEKLKAFREANDNHGLLFTLNEGIHGNLGGMGSAKLYKKSNFGTKRLITDYVDEVSHALDYISQPKLKGVKLKEQIDFFARASLCFGRSALMMSGSGTYLFYHIGVLKALWEQDLIPEVISGSSGGAFVAGVIGTRTHKSLSEIFEPEYLALESELRSIFSNYFSGDKSNTNAKELKDLVSKLIPDLTFEEAYALSGIQINISITPAETHQKSRLLNAVTSPNVLIREAVMASCSIPGVFAPVTLAAKNVDDIKVPYLPSRKWVDGSLSDDLPMKRLSRLYGVNHFIVSQTNPIVLPFISGEKKNDGLVATISDTGFKTLKDWGLAAGHILQKPFKSDSYFSKLINGYISMVSQTYTGDINILPTSRFLNPAKAIAVRSNQEILELIREGEKSTWPQIEKIRIQTQISRTLWQIVKELDARLLRTSTRSAKRNKLKLVNKDGG